MLLKYRLPLTLVVIPFGVSSRYFQRETSSWKVIAAKEAARRTARAVNKVMRSEAAAMTLRLLDLVYTP